MNNYTLKLIPGWQEAIKRQYHNWHRGRPTKLDCGYKLNDKVFGERMTAGRQIKELMKLEVTK